jgi:hypothetical protein
MGQEGKKFRLDGQIKGKEEEYKKIKREVNLITVTIKLHLICNNVGLCVISDFRLEYLRYELCRNFAQSRITKQRRSLNLDLLNRC